MRNPLIRFSLTLAARPARSLARVSSATLATFRPVRRRSRGQQARVMIIAGRTGDHYFTRVRTYGIDGLRIRLIGAAHAGAEPE